MPFSSLRIYSLHIFLLLFLVLLPYTTTIHHSWHLDDYPNILHNSALHIQDLHPTTLIKTFHAHPSSPGRFFRPVANFSFALNWFFGQSSTVGYHLVNIVLHLTTTFLLYVCCIFLLQGPGLKKHPRSHHASIALIAAALWALAPIHTQAVTYIVQRMAQLAALFTAATILFYLMARLTTNTLKRIFFYLGALCFALLAFGSKENAILLPLSILLIEFIFISPEQTLIKRIQENTKKSLGLFIIFLMGGGCILWYYGSGFFNYENRNFTLLERILTEPRILILYLSQLFFPSASRLSIEHDIFISSTLLSPWYTLPAIITCTGLIFFSILRIRKNPLLSFAILFFFLNHLVESTFLPLELLFEHRNYLPSLFLFLPFSVIIVNALNSNVSQVKKGAIFFGCCGFLVFAGTSSIARNSVWANEQSLWKDAVAKAPASSRAKLNLAQTFVAKQQYNKAISLYDQAEQLPSANKNKIIPISFNLKGGIAYNLGEKEKALHYFMQALALQKDYTEVRYKVLELLIELKQNEKALILAAKWYKQTQEPQLLLIQATLLLRLNRPQRSLNTFLIARRYFRTSSLITAGQGKALGMMGNYKQADRLLSFAMAANEPEAPFLRIENSLNWGQPNQAGQLLRQLLGSIPLSVLLDNLNKSEKGAYKIPYTKLLIRKRLFAISVKYLDNPSENKKKTYATISTTTGSGQASNNKL
jgi:tetratricopeptide (TPR) repeat protein